MAKKNKRDINPKLQKMDIEFSEEGVAEIKAKPIESKGGRANAKRPTR